MGLELWVCCRLVAVRLVRQKMYYQTHMDVRDTIGYELLIFRAISSLAS